VGRETPLVYLIHDSDELRVRQERTRLVAELLPAEHRAANLTEIEPPTNRTLSLSLIMGDLTAELATPSFFPEVRRVVVVEQLADLIGSPSGEGAKASGAGRRKPKKASEDADPITAFCRFLERDLPLTGNILIISIIEEPDKRRRIRTNSPLYQAIQSLGRVLQFNEPPVIFHFLDAFATRDLATALRVLPDLLEGEDGVASVFRMLTRQVRFLIQAKLLERAGGSKEEAAQFAEQHFPPEKGLNLMLEHIFVTDKTRRAAARWTLGELNALLPRLEQLIKIVYPSSADTYVPDPEMELERFILDACGPAVRAAAKR
jgi:hypothetical protein